MFLFPSVVKFVLIVLVSIEITIGLDITNSLDSILNNVKPESSNTDGEATPSGPSPVTSDSQRSGVGFNFNAFPGFNPGYSAFGNTCPEQTDILDGLRLSDEPTGYPITEIAAELALRPQFAAFLVDQAVLPNTDPTIPEDPRFLTANMTCPFIRKQLWSFFKNNGICWVLQDFQEKILYANCITKQCFFCQNPFGFNTENQCLKQYELVSAYVYCPAIAFPRIINERFIIPRYCTCKVVNCASTTVHNPWLSLLGLAHLGKK